MMEIYAVNIAEDLEMSLYEKFISYIDQKKAKKIHRLLNRKDKIRTLIGDILIRSVACDHLQISNEAIQYEYNDYGKPKLKGWHRFHFNVSHSGDWVVAVVDERPSGIDIEQVNSIEYMEIAERFFSKQEFDWLRTQDADKGPENFYKLWTLKESYIKLIGDGLSIPLDSFSVIIEKDDDIYVEESSDKYEERYLRLFSIDTNHVMAVCSENHSFTKRILFQNYDELGGKIRSVECFNYAGHDKY